MLLLALLLVLVLLQVQLMHLIQLLLPLHGLKSLLLCGQPLLLLLPGVLLCILGMLGSFALPHRWQRHRGLARLMQQLPGCGRPLLVLRHKPCMSLGGERLLLLLLLLLLVLLVLLVVLLLGSTSRDL